MKYLVFFFGLTTSVTYVTWADASKTIGRVCYGGSMEFSPPRADKDNKLGIQIDNGENVPIFYSPKIIAENLDVLKPHIARMMWDGKPMKGWKKPIILKFNFPKDSDMMVLYFRPGRWRIEPAHGGKCEMP